LAKLNPIFSSLNTNTTCIHIQTSGSVSGSGSYVGTNPNRIAAAFFKIQFDDRRGMSTVMMIIMIGNGDVEPSTDAIPMIYPVKLMSFQSTLKHDLLSLCQ
jgi:hypothetical protein